VPALTLSFLVTGIPQDAQIQESDDKVPTLGKLELGFLKESTRFKIYIAWEIFDRGIELMEHFEHTGNLPDISEAISIQQRAVQLTPNDHPDMPAILNDLGIAFQSRFECIGDVSDLTEAISIKQRAVQLTQVSTMTCQCG